MKRIGLVILLLSCNILIARADIFDDLIGMLRNASATEITRNMNATVELTINDNEGAYSRQQAEVMLKRFFSQHPVKNVTLQHRGSSAQGARYAIAVYESNNVRYRVYIFVKTTGSESLVHELRIEKE